MVNSVPQTFYTLAKTAQRIAEHPEVNEKIEICAQYLRSLPANENPALAARFLMEGAYPATADKKITIGSRTISVCAARFCEISYEHVFKPSKAAMGSAAETIEKLMDNIEVACNKRTPRYLSLTQIETIFNKLSYASSGSEKQKILQDTWARMAPIEIKYFIYILRKKPLLAGFEAQNMIQAIAKAFHKDEEQVRTTYIICGSFEETVILSKQDELGNADFCLFHPRPFMHATSAEARTIDEFNSYFIEEKIDGIRCQAHIDNKKVSLFTTDSEEVTQAFPDVVSTFSGISNSHIVLDGVICVYKNEEILPSQLLRKRLKLNRPSNQILTEAPALFVVFDLLHHNGQSFFQHALVDRRVALEKLATIHGLPVTNQFEAANYEELEYLLERSSGRGNRGLMLKKRASTYNCDQRDESWLKVKNKTGTLNGVIMYAHTDTSNRSNKYTAFTLGVNVTSDERYEEDFIPIGKIPGSCSEQELHKLDRQIQKLTVEKYGPTLGLIPGIVVKAEFDDIQVNKRTKANYKLYRPHFKSIYWNLTPDRANTLKDVEQIYQQKIERVRLKQDENPSFIF